MQLKHAQQELKKKQAELKKSEGSYKKDKDNHTNLQKSVDKLKVRFPVVTFGKNCPEFSFIHAEILSVFVLKTTGRTGQTWIQGG